MNHHAPLVEEFQEYRQEVSWYLAMVFYRRLCRRTLKPRTPTTMPGTMRIILVKEQFPGDSGPAKVSDMQIPGLCLTASPAPFGNHSISACVLCEKKSGCLAESSCEGTSHLDRRLRSGKEELHRQDHEHSLCSSAHPSPSP